ncbi:hypothetical protein PACILC2_36980 [Paenibacillus cisolokensis]|uniref:G5 domain-containing protein n=1 Tax=Paenibacillus cisolokensis TaxID=1658519 RepID=A0ABQ4NA55_9BACL|nr:hypothetical protein PACILC2_36980 [Paenibacillus cisolokensis]
MGVFSKNTHGKRSSSMSFAMRWKHENLRLILLSVIISIAMAFMLLVLLYGSANRSVSVVLDGQESVVKTKQWVLQELLEEQSITIGPYDKVSMPLNGAVKDGDRIEIEKAIPVKLKNGSKESTVFTTEKTVGSLIQEMNIEVREQDKVFPSLDTELQSNMKVHVVRIDKHITKQQQEIPYQVVRKEDPTLEKGKQKIVRTGKNGVVVRKYEKIFQNGMLVSHRLVTKTVQKPSVSQVVAIGTKNPEPKVTLLSNTGSVGTAAVSKAGLTFKPKKTLKNVTLTAYSAGVESTGKSENHPEYGITASGARVQEGRTIAVDPNVIPLGWWVYIEGIGLRRAEDTGGAIKGNKIDVYFDSESYATKFGRKHGYTVYVLGPNKPSSN